MRRTTCFVALILSISHTSGWTMAFDVWGMAHPVNTGVWGSFSGDDTNNDGRLDLAELIFFNIEAGEPANPTSFGPANLSAFIYDGELSLIAVSGASKIMVNSDGTPLVHHYSLNGRVGPLFVAPQYPGSGLHTYLYIRLGSAGTAVDGGTLLGSFTIDDVADAGDLATRVAVVSASDMVHIDATGRWNEIGFVDGLASPDGTGGAGVEVHYQCGSPNITCWGSIDDFIDLHSAASSGPVAAPALVSMQVMAGTAGMTTVPVESAFLVVLPSIGDSDGDGLDDSVDNCTLAANAAQTDTDGDSIGNQCDPDIAPPANDCLVNFLDLSSVKDAFFSNPASPSWNPDADFNVDNQINFGDLSILEALFFGAPGPSAAGCN